MFYACFLKNIIPYSYRNFINCSQYCQFRLDFRPLYQLEGKPQQSLIHLNTAFCFWYHFKQSEFLRNCVFHTREMCENKNWLATWLLATCRKNCGIKWKLIWNQGSKRVSFMCQTEMRNIWTGCIWETILISHTKTSPPQWLGCCCCSTKDSHYSSWMKRGDTRRRRHSSIQQATGTHKVHAYRIIKEGNVCRGVIIASLLLPSCRNYSLCNIHLYR